MGSEHEHAAPGLDHAVIPITLGGSTEAASEQSPRGRALRHAQHVMPLTVASELGIVGLVLVGWLLAVLARLALGRGPARPERLALGLALLAACAAPGMIEER